MLQKKIIPRKVYNDNPVLNICQEKIKFLQEQNNISILLKSTIYK